MSLDRLVAIAGTIASFAGLLVALVQTIRLRELRRRTNADVWLAIAYTTSLIRNLEESKASKENIGIAKAYKGASDLYKQLLKHAILDERRFDERTIQEWSYTKRLETPWQIAQARRFLTRHIGPSSEGKPVGESES